MNPLPEGFRLVLDPSVRSFRNGTVLVGGHPGRLLTLSRRGVEALDALVGAGHVSGAGHVVGAARQLGTRLVEAGLAHPRPDEGGPRSPSRPDLTVVVPVQDRSASLDRCLRSLGSSVPVVVVDDASVDPASVADVCARHGALLLTRSVNGGPGVARNDALAVIDTDLVALVDSDCTVDGAWIRDTTWLFDDPAIGAVAPRVRPLPPRPGTPLPVLARFLGAHSPLDMGAAPSEVGPEQTVRYVPTAALVARRSALAEGFDPELRVGEDVDLVWRLLEHGWRVRYEPTATVWHAEPSTWRGVLARRFRYGTSAGPLARRHPGRLAPVELRPWSSAAVVAGLAGRPRLAAAMVLASTAAMARSFRHHGIPLRSIGQWSAQGVGWTVVGVGRAATTLAAPALVLAAGRSRKAALAVSLLVVCPPLVEWRRRRPDLDPVRWTAVSILDDVAYGAGVWTGCLRARSLGPLLPSVRIRRSGRPTPVRHPGVGRPSLTPTATESV